MGGLTRLRMRPDCHWLSRRRETRPVPQAERLAVKARRTASVADEALAVADWGSSIGRTVYSHPARPGVWICRDARRSANDRA